VFRTPDRSLFLRLGLCLIVSWLSTGPALAQPAGTPAEPVAGQGAASTPPADTRAGLIAAEQAAKAQDLRPYAPNKAEALLDFVETQLMGGGVSWHAFFDSAYQGGGFTLGAGYLKHVGSYNTLDMRGSITFANYQRLEAEYRAPRLFDRRGVLSVIGGWRQATQVGFFGLGTPDTSQDDRVNYGFQQPYATAKLDVRPTRKLLLFGTGVEFSQWNTMEGAGSFPSIEEVYTPETLPGLGASPTYLQVLGTAAIDSRDAAGYSRRGGYYGVTARNFADTDDVYSFRQVDYEAIQHIPIRRDAWILSLRGRVETTYTDDGVEMPFFMLPSLGGGSTLRGYQSWRFRDRHSLLLSAEWRILVNRFIDTAIFYDAGKVTRRISDLDLSDLKENYGIGFRLHGPAATPLRIDIARGNEGLRIVFAASSSF
jgi:outer membrane translocation and assembly module TamA